MATLFCNSSGTWQTSASAATGTASETYPDHRGPDVSACGWLSERTRVLQQFAQLQLKLQDRRTLLETLRHFDNFTKPVIKRDDNGNGSDGSEVMDFVFSVRTIANFAKELRPDTEHLAGPLLDIINGLLELPDDLLATAQVEDNSCVKLLEVLRLIPNVAASSVLHKTNVAMEAFSVKPESFAGLTCSWMQQQDSAGVSGRFFYCTIATSVHSNHGNHSSNNNGTIMNNSKGSRKMLASIQVPPSLFHQLHQMRVLQRSSSKYGIDGNTSNINIVMATERIRVSMLSGGGLFPTTVEEVPTTDRNGSSTLREEITSPVVGFAIDNLTLDTITLTEPVLLVILSSPTPHCVTPPRPVWYDTSTRRWSAQGCHALNHHRDSSAVVFQCRQLGAYALQQTCDDTIVRASGNGRSAGEDLDQDEVVVLGWVVGGTVVLWLGLACGMYGAWLMGQKRWYRTMVPVRARHAQINTWLALAFLSALFTIVMFLSNNRSIDGRRICTILGVLMHYLTLCILLWVCVGLNALYQRLRRRITLIKNRGNLAILRLNSTTDQVIIPTTDNDPDDLPTTTPQRSTTPPSPIPAQTSTSTPPPPLLSIYLIGWGVAALLCGISAAVTVREYSTTFSGGSTCPLPLFTPSLGDSGTGGVTVTVWAPYVALGLVICALMVLVRVRCGQLRWLLDGRRGLGRMSEGDGTQATEQVDLELLEPPSSCPLSPTAIINPSTPTSLSSSHLRHSSSQHPHHRWRATSSCIATALASNSSDQSSDDQSDVDTPHHHHHHASETSNSDEQQCACCDPNVEWLEVRLRVAHLMCMVGLVICSGGLLVKGGDRIGWSVSYAVMAAVVGVFALGVGCVWRVNRARKTCHWPELFKRTSPHFATSTQTTTQPPQSTTPQPSASTSVAVRPASSSNNSNTSNKPQPQYVNGNAALTANDAAVQLQTLLIVDNSQPQGVKITNIEAAAARGQQYIVGGMPNIIENCAQSAEMFYNPHQSFVARRFFRKQKQQRSMQKRNNMMIARHNDRDIFAGNSSKVNNTNIHTELLDTTGGETSGRSRGNRRRNLNILSENTEEDITADKGKRRDRYRPGHHKKRENIGRDIDPQMQPQQLHMMRTVSQQCTLKYSSDNITGDMDFDGGATALDKSLGSNPIEPTYCNVVEMKMQLAAAAAAIGPPDGMEKDNKSPRLFINPMHNMYPMDSMDQQRPPDLLLTLDRNISPPHNSTSIDQQTTPSTDQLQSISSPLLLDTPTAANTNQSTSAAVSCSSVCPSELDELYQQIRGAGTHPDYARRRVGKSRSQIVLLDEDQRCNRLDGDGRWQHPQQHQWQSDSEVNNGYYVDYRGGKERRKGGKTKGETRL